MNMNSNRKGRKPRKNNKNPSRSKYLVRERELTNRVNIRDICIPDETRVTLRYNQLFTMTSTAGIGSGYSFRGNSPFDPDLTGTGAQPTGYDQWSQFYFNQKCLGSRIKLKPIPTTNTYTVQAAAVCPLPGVSTLTVTSGIQDVKSSKLSKWAQYNLYDKLPTLQQTASTSEIFGKSPSAVENDDTFGSLTSANPTNQWVWFVGFQDVTGNTSSAIFSVEIDYDIVFWGRINLGQS